MVKARLVDAALIQPPQEVHLIMSQDAAVMLRDILAKAHTGAFYQELCKIVGDK